MNEIGWYFLKLERIEAWLVVFNYGFGYGYLILSQN